MKRTILKIGVILTIAALSGILFAYVAHAAYEIPDQYAPDNIPLSDLEYGFGHGGESGLIQDFQILAGALLYLAAPLAVIAIGMTAFNMVINSGSSEKVETAKKQLTWAVLGLVLIILSYATIKFVIEFVPQILDEVPIEETVT